MAAESVPDSGVGTSILSPIDSERGIARVSGVCGGEPCIEGTRLPVWVLYQAQLAGVPDAELLESYPFITPRDLKNAWRYVRDHKEEMQTVLRENNMW
jgi:uncharacterized protein (DUF433 family)